MNDRLTRCFKQVMIAQGLLGFFVALLCWLFSSEVMALSVAFGASIALFNTALSKRSVRKSSELAYSSLGASMVPIYVGWLQRLLIFCVAIVLGLNTFGLLPIGFVGGFAISQIGYFACKMK
ncbi:MAG: hypothetical protein ACI9J2_001460 [Saprospiraceae bacterium]|jgi:hypothetical protein